MANLQSFTQFVFVLILFGSFGIILSSSNNYDPRRWLLSFGKPVTQSSTEGNQVASLVTDGNFKDDDSDCGKTTISDNPYVELDLGNDTLVYAVAIVFPGSQQTYSNIKVKVSNSDGSDGYTKDGGSITAHNKLDTYPRRSIRYVRISREEPSTQLSVCEIAAYQMPFENIAMKKPATSSTDIAYGGPIRATDLSWSARLMTKSENNPWLKIDLKDVYLVNDILVSNAMGSTHMGPMSDLTIRIGLSSSIINDNPLCTVTTLYVGESRLLLYCDMFGQIIVFHRPGIVGALYIAEVFVNTDNAEYVPAKAAVSNTQHQSSRAPYRTIDLDIVRYWFKTKIITQEKTLTVELAGEFNIVMIYIITRLLKQIEIKLGLNEDITLQKHCIPGLHDLDNFGGYYFFCVEKTLTKYIHVHQYDKERMLQISEIYAFEKTKPVLNYNKKNIKYVWADEHSDVTLSCDINGYPVPVFSWVRNKTTISIGSRSLTLLRVKQNDSNTYECWANNSIGHHAMLVKFRVASKWRICADHTEMKFDLKTTTVVEDFQILGNQWYSSYDQKQFKYLQFKETAPSSASACQLWLNRKHPGLQHGIVSGTLCLKNTTHDCAATFDVDIRRCTAYHIYHFATLRSTTKYTVCFEPAAISRNGQQPAISSAIPNYALFDHVFQTEIDVADSYTCFAMCQVDKQCKSFNYSRKEKICEMNTATKKEFPGSYRPRIDYSYNHLGGGILKVAGRRNDL